MNIASQSELWLTNLRDRKRKPARPSTLATLGSYVRVHIVTSIGQAELAAFGNAQMKRFVSELAENTLSPKTIAEVVSAVKSIIGSAVNPDTGDQLYPRVWNAEFVDAPMIEGQHQPTVTAPQIERAIAEADAETGILYTLLAASGLRISEALALRTDSISNGTVQVNASVWRGEVVDHTKTTAGRRTIEIAEPVAETVAAFTAQRPGRIFDRSESLYRKRLAEAGVPGFHSFRRFRTTVLRGAHVPEDIIKSWLGHSGGTITDRYSKLGQDAQVRREWADRVGLGFTI